MTPQEISAIIMLARRAPLTNMAEAEAASRLLQKLAQHFAPKVGEGAKSTKPEGPPALHTPASQVADTIEK